NALAYGPNDTALGGNAQVNADGSTAVGANASISANATNAVAVGESATVTAASGTSVGQGASVSANNAVAIGRGSSATRANTVSVGSAGNERQISNVAAGSAATDAVNVAQMQAGDSATLSSANAYTDSRMAGWDDNLTKLRTDTDQRFQHLDRRIDRMGAVSAAYAGMAVNTSGLAGANRIGVGVGSQGGESALAVGYQRAIGNRASVSLGGAFSGSEKSVSAGAGFSW
ncbi:YadA family autotransporter adhesin, partial [Xanthomonas sacchari]